MTERYKNIDKTRSIAFLTAAILLLVVLPKKKAVEASNKSMPQQSLWLRPLSLGKEGSGDGPLTVNDTGTGIDASDSVF